MITFVAVGIVLAVAIFIAGSWLGYQVAVEERAQLGEGVES